MSVRELAAGRYRLLERLGEGGAGTVWRAHDAMLRRHVAIKEMRGTGDFAQRAIREARAAARVNHPCIVMVHDVVIHEGRPWIVMDLVEGRSLDRVLAQDGPLPPYRAAEVGLRILDALEAAHAHGLLHRDVKPANVLVDRDGTAMLTDFGIAAPLTGEEGATGLAGSAGYIAPERLRGEPAGPASDLWSLGATLYTAVEGVAPFRRELPEAVAAAVLMHDPPAPVRAGPELGGLLLAMLAKDPAQRPAPARIREVLRRVAGGYGAPTDPSPRQPAPEPVPPRRRGPWPLLAAAAAVLVAAGGAALGWQLLGAREPAVDRGRFPTAPHPCELLTVAQVEELVHQVTEPRESQANECQWEYTKNGIAYRWIAVRVYAAAPNGELGAPQLADRLFAAKKAERASLVGTKEVPEYHEVTNAVRPVPGVGEEAFLQEVDRQGALTSRTRSTVWLRVSNLIVEVEWVRAEKGGLTPDDQRTVLRAARQVARYLTAAAASPEAAQGAASGR